MKTLKLNILKKNRVYFKCLTENGYEVKLKITPKSESLALGEQELLVNDCSVRTKYGTDVIYELEEVAKKDSVITLSHKYNYTLVEKCKDLGGKWDADARVWVFNSIVEDKVEELELKYNQDIVEIEITAKSDLWAAQRAVSFMGYRIARATGRDSGAHICDGIAMISGSVQSDGSMKNWGTEVKAGSVFRLHCSLNLLKSFIVDNERWELKIINTGSV